MTAYYLRKRRADHDSLPGLLLIIAAILIAIILLRWANYKSDQNLRETTRLQTECSEKGIGWYYSAREQECKKK